ncbi:unnamed protein product, partial [Polarella glacialis]
MGKRSSGWGKDGALQGSWCCSGCGLDNWDSRSNCRHCSVRKNFAQALMSKGPAPTWGREKVPTTSKRVAPAHTGVIDVDMAGDVENAPPSKDDVLNKVKNIEFLLKSVSNHSPDLKADLTIKLDEARQELRGTKPLGARLDALKGAIARNEEKLEEANAAVAKAVSHQETVQDKLMELRTARAVVEMDLASGGDVGVEASGAPSATAAVEALMQRINDMQRQQ